MKKLKSKPKILKTKLTNLDPYKGIAGLICNLVPEGYRFSTFVRKGTKAVLTCQRIEEEK